MYMLKRNKGSSTPTIIRYTTMKALKLLVLAISVTSVIAAFRGNIHHHRMKIAMEDGIDRLQPNKLLTGTAACLTSAAKSGSKDVCAEEKERIINSNSEQVADTPNVTGTDGTLANPDSTGEHHDKDARHYCKEHPKKIDQRLCQIA